MNNQKIKCYLASGFFNEQQLKIVELIESVCSHKENIELFSPRKSSLVPPGSITDKKFRAATFNTNLEQVDKSDCVICSTEGKDMGAIFEASRAYAKGIPIFYIYITDNPLGFNLMLSESAAGVITMTIDILKLLEILDTEGLQSNKLKEFEYGGIVE